MKGEKGIRVLAEHLPIQLVTRCAEKMWLIKYHVSGNRSSIAELDGGVDALRCVCAYHECTWHFNAKFVDDEGRVRANLQKESDWSWSFFRDEEFGVPLPR